MSGLKVVVESVFVRGGCRTNVQQFITVWLRQLAVESQYVLDLRQVFVLSEHASGGRNRPGEVRSAASSALLPGAAELDLARFATLGTRTILALFRASAQRISAA